MVGSRSITLVGIYTGHELGCGILWQLLHDMYCLVVLTLRVDDVNGLCLVADDTTVTNLSTHLTIEWGIVEYELIELILLLCDLSVSEDVTLIFGIVITYELLLTCGKFYPVAILDSSSIAGALLLLLHLYIKLRFINGKAVLATDQFCQVEWETIGVEQTEGLLTIELGLALSLQLLHGIVEHTDTLIQGAQERIFFFLHHL